MACNCRCDDVSGSLAPSSLPLSDPDYHRSIDVVFATYRIHTNDVTVILPSDQLCIDKIFAARPSRFGAPGNFKVILAG